MKTVWMAEPVWRLVSCACSRGVTDGLRAEQVHPIAASATMVRVPSGVSDFIFLLRVGAFAYTSHRGGSSQHGVTSGRYFSSRAQALNTWRRAYFLSTAGTTCHGASGRCVRSNISWMATSYSFHLRRLRQSSGVI